MATAFAERERTRRGLDDTIDTVTGGVDPHDHVHGEVIEALQEEGIDIGDRAPRRITADETRQRVGDFFDRIDLTNE
jgi:protein-tyrosine-phosphatase